MYVLLDRDKCTGLGICESIDPDRFEIDDDGELLVLKDDVSDEELATVQEAVSGCPTAALRLAAQRP